ncbi:lipopolysaccharide-induced tumor necrosis factor-alpha factor homolog [Bombyx mandarina]|uniref:Lipopolysaccharide-induced tumor necrosis factor-alpha factor homolog n=1 Tax=Bombyx mandarina TaxID=7092 RepID=A0A6J2JG62_BOMMA|nr:lipopolysaccharide-induced tumor necrosis factor-alpha factor homolog [Bombyx mandarina]
MKMPLVQHQADLSGVDIAETTQNPPPYNNQMQTDLYHVVPTVPTQQFITVQAPQMGPKPARYTCPSCKASITTRVEYVSATKTHLCALLLCCLCCWPCACIPYCGTSCRNATHYCPNCSAYIGSYIG